MKPFSTIAGVLLLLVALAHVWRLYSGIGIHFGDHDVPMWASWLGAAVPGFLGLMVLSEARR